jgi:hypothetical protein
MRLIPGMMGVGMKENDWGGAVYSSMIYCKIFANATIYPQHNNKKEISKRQ